MRFGVFGRIAASRGALVGLPAALLLAFVGAMTGCTGSDESEPAPGPVRLPSSVPSQVWSVADEGPDEGGPIAVADGTVFVGNVSMVGRSSGTFAEFQVGSAVPELADPDVDGEVLAIVDDGAGGWVVGGEFTTVGGRPCRGIAHLTIGHRLDRRLCHGVNKPVFALARRGSTVYLAGSFTRVGGEPRSNLAALDLESGRLLPWTTTVTGRPVYDEPGGELDLVHRYVSSLAVLGDTVYIGGFFEQVGGEPRKNLAALDVSSARVLTWRADVGEPLVSGVSFEFVGMLEAVPGRLYVSGSFSRISGVPRESIGAVDTATGRLLDWRVRPASLVEGGTPDIAVHRGSVYLLSTRSSPDDPAGGARDSLAVVDAGTGRGRSYGPFASSVSDVNALMALVVDGHRLVVGGSFDGLGGHRDASFLTLDLRTGKVLGWGPATDGWATALAVRDGAVALGGGFHMIARGARDGLASFDARTGKLLPLRPRLAFGDEFEFARVSNLVVDGSTLYLAGRFTAVDGQPRTGLAAIDIATGKLTDWAPKVTGAESVLEIGGLALEGDAVYVDGDDFGFDTVNGEPREGFARSTPRAANSWIGSRLATTHRPATTWPQWKVASST